MLTPRSKLAALLALTFALSRSASAQSLRDQTMEPSSANGPSRVISANPFLPLFGYFSAEYEQRVKDNVAFALSGSHIKFDDRYTNLDAKIRLYPNDKALEGFGMASSLGMAWIRREGRYEDCTDFGCVPLPRKTFTTPSFAIELSYQWMLGRSKSTAITAGFGAKRYLGGSRADFDGIARVLPTGRLSIGYGF